MENTYFEPAWQQWWHQCACCWWGYILPQRPSEVGVARVWGRNRVETGRAILGLGLALKWTWMCRAETSLSVLPSSLGNMCPVHPQSVPPLQTASYHPSSKWGSVMAELFQVTELGFLVVTFIFSDFIPRHFKLAAGPNLRHCMVRG